MKTRFHLAVCTVLLVWILPAQEVMKPKDYLSKEFHKERREQVRKKLPANSMAIFFSNPVRNRANDVDYIYHQDPNFYYLTGFREPHSVLIIYKEMQKSPSGEKYNEIVFVQPRDETAEMWTGRRLGAKGVQNELGIKFAFENKDFMGYDIPYASFEKVLFTDFHDDIRNTSNDGDLHDLIDIFKEKSGYNNIQKNKSEKKPSITRESPTVISGKNLDTKILRSIMDDLRGIKTEAEIELLEKAIDISCIGQVEVMKAMKPGMSEREVQGIHEFVFKKYGAEYEGYPSIVGAGHNGCILHYIDNEKPEINNKELILMDLGAEYHGYTADVTRTIPVKGKFSKEQKAIYDLVYKAQEAAIQGSVAGAKWNSTLQIARKIINEGLYELGIIESIDQKHKYFPHGISHHIGLDVHDHGNRGQFEAGMVITVEPGIYIPKNAPCDPKWWGIAVRIEDCVLITKEAPILLSDMAPRTSAEVEKMMQQKSPLDNFILPDINKK